MRRFAQRHHSRSAKRPLKARMADATQRALSSRTPPTVEDLARHCDISPKQAGEVLAKVRRGTTAVGGGG